MAENQTLAEYKRLRKTIRQRERRALARGEQIERANLPSISEIKKAKTPIVSAIRQAQAAYQELVIETTPIAEPEKPKRYKPPKNPPLVRIQPEPVKPRRRPRRMSAEKTAAILEEGVKKGFYLESDARLIQNAQSAFPDLKFRDESEMRLFLDYVTYRTESEKSMKMYYKLQIFSKSFQDVQKADYENFDELKRDFEDYKAENAKNLARAEKLDKSGLGVEAFNKLWKKAMRKKKG